MAENKQLSRLGEYIYALPGFPAEVTPKFIGELPSLSDVGCGIVLLDGAYTLEYFAPPEAAPSLEGEATLFRPLVRFMVRTKTYPEGADWCEKIKDLMHRYTDDFIISSIFRGSIMYLGRSAEKLHEFQLTFSTIVKE